LTLRFPRTKKSVAFRRVTVAGSDLWVRDLSRGTETKFTSDPSTNLAPFWSPKGDRLVYTSSRSGGVLNLYQKSANGGGKDPRCRGRGRLLKKVGRFSC
jgi:Tol biopolymer transport system component